MIPAAFDYRRAESVAHALALLAEHGTDAKVIAGGQSLLPMMKLRMARPALLVDIGRLHELRYVRVEGEEVAIGALTRHCALLGSQLLRAQVPLLPAVAAQVGDRQIRHRGTIGGSVAHADPVADLPTALLALGATFVLVGSGGQRSVPATEFFTWFFETALAPDELLVQVRVPRTGSAGWGYEKFALRPNDWATVAVAAVDGRVALAGVAPTPVRAASTEQVLAAGGGAERAAQRADEGTSPPDDAEASADYRRHLARLLTRRVLQRAAQRPA